MALITEMKRYNLNTEYNSYATELTVAGVAFVFPVEFGIEHIYIYYNNSEFIELSKAYDLGIITERDVGDIHWYHVNEAYITTDVYS